VNLELLDKYQFAKGELPGKLELAQSYINQSRDWEELGDEPKSNDALTCAKIIIVEVGAVIKLALNQVISSDNDGKDRIKAGLMDAVAVPNDPENFETGLS
jgi:hypothetical protein